MTSTSDSTLSIRSVDSGSTVGESSSPARRAASVRGSLRSQPEVAPPCSPWPGARPGCANSWPNIRR